MDPNPFRPSRCHGRYYGKCLPFRCCNFHSTLIVFKPAIESDWKLTQLNEIAQRILHLDMKLGCGVRESIKNHEQRRYLAGKDPKLRIPMMKQEDKLPRKFSLSHCVILICVKFGASSPRKEIVQEITV